MKNKSLKEFKRGRKLRLSKPVIALISVALLLSGCSSLGKQNEQEAVLEPLIFVKFIDVKSERRRLNEYLEWENVEPTGFTQESSSVFVPEYLHPYIKYFYIEEQKEEYSWAAGLAWPKHGIITISPNYQNAESTTFHEIGHLIDYKFSPTGKSYLGEDYLSDQIDWVNIWEQEWKPYKSIYGSTSPDEGFADAFSTFYTSTIGWQKETIDYETLKPLSHNYMRKLSNLIRNYNTKD